MEYTFDIAAVLRKLAGGANVRETEPMREHTSFRIGGDAKYFVSPDSLSAAKEVICWLKEEKVPFFVMGNGTNLLVSDAGFDGVIVQFGKSLSAVRAEEDGVLYAEAGASLAQIAAAALRESLQGFAFAAGIPGTFGGAAIMNAGAYGGEMKDVLTEVTALTKDGQIKTILPAEMGLSYRTSAFKKEGMTVLSGRIRLQEGDAEQIRLEMEDLAERRRSKQPLHLPSAGSTFKRPEGYFAGKLISDAGLKGFSIGGAQVSEKHAGFIVNTGGATAADVKNLIAHVQDAVEREFGVRLETEVVFLGSF